MASGRTPDPDPDVGSVPGCTYGGGVYRFLLTPRWWGINVFVVLAIPVCLFMGSWQLARFEDRVEGHRQQERAADGRARPGEPLAALLPVTGGHGGRTARVTGRYDTAHPLLGTRAYGHGREGFYVLSLLRTDAGPGRPGQSKSKSAKALPVVRGWLPGDADPARCPRRREDGSRLGRAPGVRVQNDAAGAPRRTCRTASWTRSARRPWSTWCPTRCTTPGSPCGTPTGR